MDTYSWYAALVKPTWAPPAFLFGPVWTILYILIFISFCYVFYKTYQGDMPYFIAGIFMFNIIANLLFTPIQFGLQNNLLASADIIMVLGSLSLALYYIFPYASWVAYVNFPYLAWVSFATVLQLTITYLNW